MEARLKDTHTYCGYCCCSATTALCISATHVNRCHSEDQHWDLLRVVASARASRLLVRVPRPLYVGAGMPWTGS